MLSSPLKIFYTNSKLFVLADHFVSAWRSLLAPFLKGEPPLVQVGFFLSNFERSPAETLSLLIDFSRMCSQFVLRCGYHLPFVRKDMYLMDVKLFFLRGIKGSIPSSILSFFFNKQQNYRDRHFTQGFIELIPSLICHYKNIAQNKTGAYVTKEKNNYRCVG